MEIKLKNPKTCSHCAAYADSYCQLGYEIERVPLSEAKIWRHFNTWEDAVIRIKPAEPCPKPKNITEKLTIARQVDVHRQPKVDVNQVFMTKEEGLAHYVNMKRE